LLPELGNPFGGQIGNARHYVFGETFPKHIQGCPFPAFLFASLLTSLLTPLLTSLNAELVEGVFGNVNVECHVLYGV
jgi:hypothetical protein